MESIVMDQSAARPRTGGASVPAIGAGNGARSGLARARSSISSYYSVSSFNDLVSGHRSTTGGFASSGPRPPPLHIYSSLPPSFSSVLSYFSPAPKPPSCGLLPPPHLPLPPPALTTPRPGNNTAAPSYNASISNGRLRDQRKKPKPTPSRKEVQTSTGTPAEGKKPLQDTASEDDVYSLSPPPSSLPLPSLSLLIRARTVPAAAAAGGLFTAEVTTGAVVRGAAVDGCGRGGGADEIRRFLCI